MSEKRKLVTRMQLENGTLNKEKLELGRGFDSKVRVQWTLRNKQGLIVHRANTKDELLKEALNLLIKENDLINEDGKLILFG